MYRLYNNLVIFRVKKVYPTKLGEIGLQKLQNGESLFRENSIKIAHGINFAPKIIPAWEDTPNIEDEKPNNSLSMIDRFA